jgi:O-glycosyl hydrolase
MYFSQNHYCKTVIAASLFLSVTCCKGSELQEKNNTPEGIKTVSVTINPAKTYQVMDHFGASDAWAGQFVGNWPDAKRNAIADLLFSRDTLASGQPKGIGLSLWRFNIGAGTAEQGTASGIKDEWRRAEGFLNDDGTYNFNKQAGQIWLMNAAKMRGVNEFLAFPNSPPVQLTTNKKGYASNGKPNLSTDQFGKFADYLADVITGIRQKTGITINNISPVNEPQWDWSDGGQEGTPFFNNEIAAITRALSASLLKQNLSTKIDVAEAGQIDYLYSEFNKQGRQNQINAFFDKSSPDYIGNLPNLSAVISGHSYFTTSPYQDAVTKRKQIAQAIQNKPGLKYWMSEYCILGDNNGDIEGQGKDLGIDPALYVARVIHNDLVNANASAWHWWLAISPYNYKDGLIYIDKNKTDGNFQTSKMLWALGQYSHFIQPGAVRIDVENNSELLISAFKNTNNQLVTVIVNPTDQSIPLNLNYASSTLKNKIYQTSAQEDMTPVSVKNSGAFAVQPKSIMTVIGHN